MTHVRPELKTWRDAALYYADFAMCIGVVAAVVWADFASIKAQPFAWSVVFVFGFVFWTYNEYWVHRLLLHRVFWHGTHEEHHLKPTHYVIFPAWQIPLAWAAFGFFVWLEGGYAWAMYAGFTAGYFWFLLLHDLLHHVADMGKPAWQWLNRYAIWHNRHHRFGNVNYGITTPIWDRVHGTYL